MENVWNQVQLIHHNMKAYETTFSLSLSLSLHVQTYWEHVIELVHLQFELSCKGLFHT